MQTFPAPRQYDAWVIFIAHWKRVCNTVEIKVTLMSKSLPCRALSPYLGAWAERPSPPSRRQNVTVAGDAALHIEPFFSSSIKRKCDVPFPASLERSETYVKVND